MVDSSDQRDFRRMGLDCALEFRRSDAEPPSKGVARNISASGLSFDTEESLAVGDRLVVHMQPERSVVAPLDARVEVLRVETPTQDGAPYRVACKIVEFRG